MAPVLTALRIGDEPGAWAAAGFAVDDDRTTVGTVTLELVGPAGGRGLQGWTLADPARLADQAGPPGGDLDGLPTEMGPPPPPGDRVRHPNGVVALDHVVVFSPDLDRTTDALAAAGVELRRVRPVGSGDKARVQHFFRLGEAILELVGPARPDGEGPARFWGLAFTVADLDATAATLGEAVSAPKAAVQPGRRIATLRHRDLGLSVPVAFLSRRERPSDARSEERPG